MKLEITRTCKHHGTHSRWYKKTKALDYPRCCLCKVEYNKRARELERITHAKRTEKRRRELAQ